MNTLILAYFKAFPQKNGFAPVSCRLGKAAKTKDEKAI
jgi:hypothetical protein